MTKEQFRKIEVLDKMAGWSVLLCVLCALVGFFWEMMYNYDLADRWFYAAVFFFVSTYLAIFTGIWVGRPKR
mgnify:CR=1 FL=1